MYGTIDFVKKQKQMLVRTIADPPFPQLLFQNWQILV